MLFSRKCRVSNSGFQLETLESRRFMDAAAPVDDMYEPNDSPRQVLSLPSPAGAWLGAVEGSLDIAGLRLADRADWYRFRLVAAGEAGDAVAIAFRNRKGNLDLALFNSRGREEIGSSRTSRGTEAVSLQGLEPGWYMARVTGRDGALNNNYQLSLDCPQSAPADPVDDPTPVVEFNDSFDLVDSAPVGAAGSPSLGAISGIRSLNAQTLDDIYDIYKFTVNKSPGADATVSIAAGTPFNLSLFNSQRKSIGFAAGYMGQTAVSLTGLAPGDYYLQVTHYVLGHSGSFNYNLTFDAGTSSQG